MGYTPMSTDSDHIRAAEAALEEAKRAAALGTVDAHRRMMVHLEIARTHAAIAQAIAVKG